MFDALAARAAAVAVTAVTATAASRRRERREHGVDQRFGLSDIVSSWTFGISIELGRNADFLFLLRNDRPSYACDSRKSDLFPPSRAARAKDPILAGRRRLCP